MFELKRGGSTIREKIKIGDEVVEIVIVPEAVARQYNKAYAGMILAQDALNETKKAGDADLTAVLQGFGQSIVNLFHVLFGEEITHKILRFYEDNYTEMMMEMSPFIVDVIQPQLGAKVREMRERAKQQYVNGRRGKQRKGRA